MGKDRFVRALENVADAAIAPVKAGAEAVAYGEPKHETLKNAIESNVGARDLVDLDTGDADDSKNKK
jgi:hypothetical protein